MKRGRIQLFLFKKISFDHFYHIFTLFSDFMRISRLNYTDQLHFYSILNIAALRIRVSEPEPEPEPGAVGSRVF